MVDDCGFQPVVASNFVERSRLKTGIDAIDRQLGGGLPRNGIIEIFGESSSGKSQLCLQLSLMVQLDQPAAVIYICTEDTFPSKRLQQMIKAATVKFGAIDFSSNIFVEHVADFDSLKDCFTQKVPKFLKCRAVSLIVIDSVAAPFRGTYGAGQGGARTQDLRTLGGILLAMNVEQKITIVCVNQVTASMASDAVLPALGLAWSNMVTTRIQLRRLAGANRSFHIVYSPTLPPFQASYRITAHGLDT